MASTGPLSRQLYDLSLLAALLVIHRCFRFTRPPQPIESEEPEHVRTMSQDRSHPRQACDYQALRTDLKAI